MPLNPAQERAATHPSGPLLIIAGAGTGKTQTLAHRVAHLIEQGADPARISPLLDEMSDTVRERLRLPGTGTGDDEERAARMRRGPLLCGIQGHRAPNICRS